MNSQKVHGKIKEHMTHSFPKLRKEKHFKKLYKNTLIFQKTL